MKNPLIYRHGDILLVEVAHIDSKTPREDSMLAAGEHTNHGHFATGDVDVLERDSELFVQTNGKGGCVRHLLIDQMKNKQEVWTKEHTDVEIPPNKTFKVVRQVEYDPYDKKIKQVQD